MRISSWIRPSLRNTRSGPPRSAPEWRPFATQTFCECLGNRTEHAFHFGDFGFAKPLARTRERDHADQHAARAKYRRGHGGAARITFAERDVETMGANGIIARAGNTVVSENDVPGSTA